MKRPGFSKEEPKSLYRRDSPWISRYQIQNSFQLDITYISHVKTLHGFIYYIIQRIVIRIFEYKPLGLKGNQAEKAEAVASLVGILHLLISSPQVARSVAWAVLNFFFCRLG